MFEAEQRVAVIAEARKWIGTPYQNCADIRGVGVDCGMLIIRCFVDTGLCPPFDPRPYPPDWHLHRDAERYLGFVFDHCAEIEEGESQPGDIVVFKLGRCYSHGGIVTKPSPLTIVHAYWPAGKVTEQNIATDEKMSSPKRAKRFFSYWKQKGA